MRYYWKIFLWENGAKSTDYSNYCMAPIFIEDRLDETLDTGEIILDGMTRKEPFAPKTKFRLERYLTKDYTDTPKKWDFLVDHDDVEIYAGAWKTIDGVKQQLSCHRVHLIEPSVIAQGMHVDNIALTYELQDVDLNYKTYSDSTQKINPNWRDSNYIESVRHTLITTQTPPYRTDCEIRFENSYRYFWKRDGYDFPITDLNLTDTPWMSKEIKFNIPKIYCQAYQSNISGWQDQVRMRTRTIVTEYLYQNDEIISQEEKINLVSGPDSIGTGTTNYIDAANNTAYITTLNTQDYPNSTDYYFNDNLNQYRDRGQFLSQSITPANELVNFYTSTLTEAEANEGYFYKYEISVIVLGANQLPIYYKAFWNGYGISESGREGVFGVWDTDTTYQNTAEIKFNTEFYAAPDYVIINNGKFITKGEKYNAYNLLRKSMLTIDTQLLISGIDEIEYPIIIDDYWREKLIGTEIYETVFQNKNLWEVMLQVGYYIHAIPYLEFSEDDDRFVLNFRQLGSTEAKPDTSEKITIFSSRNLSEYFSQLDSYVSNFYSPQNIVEEWIVPKTSDNSYLVSNDTAELHTSFPILEIVELAIRNSDNEIKSILEHIFENSIYQVFTNAKPDYIVPAKGNSLYYTFGTNKIGGLNYVAPYINTPENMALKNIIARVFEVSDEDNIKFNEYSFYIKYRTQDDLRISQFRPDLDKYMKNSAYEKYPHHEQFYGQQDKIVDSERFSANLFGQLIRVGNEVFQKQEYAKNGQEKESGDLVKINNEPYYVVAIDSEYYPEAILQKVTYSKNFNQLSQVVTIPSEPRFYEVAERSTVRREVRIMDFFKLSSVQIPNKPFSNYLDSTTLISSAIFGNSFDYPNYAYTRFLADPDRDHGYDIDKTFPSSEVDIVIDNGIVKSVIPKQTKSYTDCIVPVMRFPVRNGLIFTWQMADNFKVGDYIDSVQSGSTGDSAYMSMQPMRYCDMFGRADLMQFGLFYKNNWTAEQTQALPRAEETMVPSDFVAKTPTGYSIALDKDNREAVSFNYQINLIHDDEFVTYPNLFGIKSARLKMCLSKKPKSVFDTSFNESDIVELSYVIIINSPADNYRNLKIEITNPGIDLTDYKSIVLYDKLSEYTKIPYIARNIDHLDNEEKLNNWYIQGAF